MSVEIGRDFYWVLHGACRAAPALRQSVIGTDTLLISTMNNFPGFRKVLNPVRVESAGRDFVQGGGISRTPLSVDAELRLDRTMREVHWRAFGWAAAEASSSLPRWDDEVGVAVRLAMAIAEARDAPWVGADHLLEALLADSANAANNFVRKQGVDLDLLTEVAQRTWPVPGGSPPRQALVEMLNRVGVLIQPGRENRRRTATLKGRAAASVLRLVAQTNPVLFLLEDEAIAETVRLGHDRTTLIHLILAVLVLEEEMTTSGLCPTAGYMQSCDFVLRHFGIDREATLLAAASNLQVGEIASPQRRRSWRSSSKNPPWTVAAVRAAEAARLVVSSGNGAALGSAHLLHAVLADSDNLGRRVLSEQFVDTGAVQDLLVRRLGLASSPDGS